MNTHLGKDLVAGLLFAAIGGAFLAGSVGMDLGTWRRIGPGGFPMLVSGLLLVLGLALTAKALMRREEERLRFDLRRVAVILAAIVAFGLVIRGGGMLPAVAVCCLVASFATRPFQPLRMAAYGLGLGALCSLAFVKGLGMTTQILGPWFGGY
ncbi:tripartite tricarboxylate transporter TctB family protein [Paenirhodobacter sp.]|uniref:tripartite tricarboxylate transporter TctB family protein n=1 Tax=Paenirhodobacter sp. TaxID=1965326 RepID=UPI003B40521D